MEESSFYVVDLERSRYVVINQDGEIITEPRMNLVIFIEQIRRNIILLEAWENDNLKFSKKIDPLDQEEISENLKDAVSDQQMSNFREYCGDY